MWPAGAFTLVALLGAIQGWMSPAWLIPPILVLPVIYVFQHPINIWYVRRFITRFPGKINSILKKAMPYYQYLQGDAKEKFVKRTLHLMVVREHIPKAMDIFPQDARAILAATQAMVTFGLDKYITPNFERVALYPSDFPSPEHKRLHASEVHEDGILVLALDRFMYAFIHPLEGYNTAIHETIEICIQDGVIKVPAGFEERVDAERLLRMRRIKSVEALKSFTGHPEIKLFHLAAEAFFTHPGTFRKEEPELYRELTLIFRQDPLNYANPADMAHFGDSSL